MYHKTLTLHGTRLWSFDFENDECLPARCIKCIFCDPVGYRTPPIPTVVSEAKVCVRRPRGFEPGDEILLRVYTLKRRQWLRFSYACIVAVWNRSSSKHTASRPNGRHGRGCPAHPVFETGLLAARLGSCSTNRTPTFDVKTFWTPTYSVRRTQKSACVTRVFRLLAMSAMAFW